MFVVIFAVCLIFMGTASCGVQHTLTSEEKLIVGIVEGHHIFSSSRPVANVTQAVPVNLGLSLTRIQSYDEEKRYVTVSAWLKLIWTDQRLKWNPKEYEGIDSISIPVRNTIWYPDIKLFNGIQPDVEKAQVNAVVINTGEVFWMLPIRFTISCEPVKQDYKPFDIQYAMNESPNLEKVDKLRPPVRCNAVFGSWTYDSSKIQIHNPSLDINAITENPMFIVADPLARKNIDIYEMSDKEWDDASFSFSLTFRDPRNVFPA